MTDKELADRVRAAYDALGQMTAHFRDLLRRAEDECTAAVNAAHAAGLTVGVWGSASYEASTNLRHVETPVVSRTVQV